MASRPRILIADDQIMFAELCQNLLGTEYTVVGIVGERRELVRAAAQLKPDLVLLDISMPNSDGLHAGSEIKEFLPSCKLLFLTMRSSIDFVAEAFRRGASGYVLKTCTSSELVTAVRTVLRGMRYVSKGISRQDLEELQHRLRRMNDQPEHLSEKQRAVLQLLSEGKVMKEIGDALGMATRTVAFHKYSMMRELQTKSSAELIKYAIRNNLVA